jgi:ubiquinone/menaquinone biosynthesis C-methylase UbiE
MHQLEEVKNCYNQTAKEYAKVFYDELSQKSFDRLVLTRFAEENKHRGKIADLGCGSGHTTTFLQSLGVKDLVGIDLSSEMIDQAIQMNESIKFEVGNMLELSKDDEEFGAVLAFYAIVHFNYEEIEKAFAEIYRTLKNSGQFLFSFHVGTEQTDLDEFLDKKVKITFYYFEVDKILEILEKLGFNVLETVVRYPYKDVEYPSKRAYVLVGK